MIIQTIDLACLRLVYMIVFPLLAVTPKSALHGQGMKRIFYLHPLSCKRLDQCPPEQRHGSNYEDEHDCLVLGGVSFYQQESASRSQSPLAILCSCPIPQQLFREDVEHTKASCDNVLVYRILADGQV